MPAAFLVELGALMMVASTMVPRAQLDAAPLQVLMHGLEQPTAEIVALQQMAEVADGRLVGHRLTAEIDADEAAHRMEVVERLLRTGIGQVESLLQEVDAQHPLQPHRPTPVASLGVERRYQMAELCPRHDRLHLGQERVPTRRLGVAIKSGRRQRRLSHPAYPQSLLT